MSDNEKVEKDDIIAMMRLKSSRNAIWKLLELSGVFEKLFSTDQSIMLANAARTDYAKVIMERLKDCAPEEYKLMIKENML